MLFLLYNHWTWGIYMITLLNKFDDNYVIGKKDIYDIVYDYVKKENIEKYFHDINFTNALSVLAGYSRTRNEIFLIMIV